MKFEFDFSKMTVLDEIDLLLIRELSNSDEISSDYIKLIVKVMQKFVVGEVNIGELHHSDFEVAVDNFATQLTNYCLSTSVPESFLGWGDEND